MFIAFLLYLTNKMKSKKIKYIKNLKLKKNRKVSKKTKKRGGVFGNIDDLNKPLTFRRNSLIKPKKSELKSIIPPPKQLSGLSEKEKHGIADPRFFNHLLKN